MFQNLKSLILRHTSISTLHLTPEIQLRLITPSSELWRCKPEDLPFEDPFWGFYWPGGQAVARYILDEKKKFRNKAVLDIGCGCGAGSIAATLAGAKKVVANDIDTNALLATRLNASLNNIVDIETSSNNFIGEKCEKFEVILLGDMFYDEEFANKLFVWLKSLTEDGKIVLIGDPGRHGLTKKRRKHMTSLSKYNLPENSCIENHGFYETSVWTINKT